MMDIRSLPRTICAVRAGADRNDRNEKAAAAVAAFSSASDVPEGSPVAVILDQTALPYDERYICTRSWERVVEAIKRLEVRGAPAIGIAGAIAVMLSAYDAASSSCGDSALFLGIVEKASSTIADARPTAVNLMWASRKMKDIAASYIEEGSSPEETVDSLFCAVQRMIAEDEAANRRIGDHGAALLPGKAKVLTHCNAGSLATAFYGTALGVVYSAASQGGIERVFADETRPVGQGARLTAWELSRAGIPVTLICDDMSASVMSKGWVDAVIVGADRVAANGDVANKIGTLGVATIAKRYHVPFYVACPISTVDLGMATGDAIEIEERDAGEVLAEPIDGVDVFNPAFDVTPAELITAIITENGVFAPNRISEALEGAADADSI